MPKSYPRSRRIADQIQRELAPIIRAEIRDPKIGMITVTDVEVSQDGVHAKIFFSLLNPTLPVKEILEILKKNIGYLRSQLARSMNMYTVPKLEFVYDDSVEEGARLSQMIDQAVSDDNEKS
jgi:ribosome-binding factor A